MTRLFVSDIDGCLAEPYQPFDLKRIRHLVDLIHSDDPAVPDFSLCSGRSYSYVEAIYQLLGLEFPVLFESGGGMFDPATSQITWNPALTHEALDALDNIRAWINKECLPGSSMMFDHGKRTQAGIVGPDPDEIIRTVPRVQEFVYENFEGFHVFDTPISIDVSVTDITKRQALEWISDLLDVPLEAIAYIGDTNGDIPALEIVGRSYAPRNGSDEVKEIVDRVTTGSVTAGVIEAYEEVIQENRVSADLSAAGS